MQLWG